MSTIADAIEIYILKMIELSENHMIELQRSDLSGLFDCVPSQINYVLKTRFSNARGYIVESRRGGGGYLRIVKVPITRTKDILQLLKESEGRALSDQAAWGLIDRLVEEGFMDKREGRLMKAAVHNESLEKAGEAKGLVRMDIIKNMLLTILREG